MHYSGGFLFDLYHTIYHLLNLSVYILLLDYSFVKYYNLIYIIGKSLYIQERNL